MGRDIKHLFGPVPSRRLGLSLGVDVVSLKTCTQNCIYCQLGVSTQQTIERKPYVPIDAVLDELTETVASGLRADYITLSGSGEPTLNSDIGRLIDEIRKITDIPVAIITNGTLLSDKAVRADCCKADLVLPSLDAGDEPTFEMINCPHKDINFRAFVEGLCRFRAEYPGQIWLEVFFSEGINTSADQIERIKAIIELIGPDKVQLNTVARPTAEAKAVRVSADKLHAIAAQMGQNAEVIADFSATIGADNTIANKGNILELLKRRPCTLDDVCLGLGVGRNETLKYLAILEEESLIISEKKNNQVFFKSK